MVASLPRLAAHQCLACKRLYAALTSLSCSGEGRLLSLLFVAYEVAVLDGSDVSEAAGAGWQCGQKWALRWAMRMRTMGVPQRTHGWPVWR